MANTKFSYKFNNADVDGYLNWESTVPLHGICEWLGSQNQSICLKLAIQDIPEPHCVHRLLFGRPNQ
ncbi:MAG: hypothetical protein NT070_02520 [Cyanobacteria bacterium]|nr:hypothetical protein [Cyanobacteriota bacterium]